MSGGSENSAVRAAQDSKKLKRRSVKDDKEVRKCLRT
jgi:hypothetical protein